MEKIVVTRHKALLEYLIKNAYVEADTKHVTYANIDDIEGKHVFGVMPYRLACHAGKITEIQLRLSPEERNKELTLEEVEFHASEPKTYTVREVAR